MQSNYPDTEFVENIQGSKYILNHVVLCAVPFILHHCTCITLCATLYQIHITLKH